MMKKLFYTFTLIALAGETIHADYDRNTWNNERQNRRDWDSGRNDSRTSDNNSWNRRNQNSNANGSSYNRSQSYAAQPTGTQQSNSEMRKQIEQQCRSKCGRSYGLCFKKCMQGTQQKNPNKKRADSYQHTRKDGVVMYNQ